MAFDVAQIRQAQKAKFYQQYVNNLLEQTSRSGTFGYDGTNASYRPGSELGSLSQEWNRFKRAAESRRITPDYMQFVQIYNTGKRQANDAFSREFNKLLARSGQDASVIKDLAKSDANFKSKLLNLTQDPTLSMEEQAAFSGYLPFEGRSQFQKDWKGRNLPTSLAPTAAGVAGAAYALSRPAGDIEGLTQARGEAFEDWKTRQNAFMDEARDVTKRNTDKIAKSQKLIDKVTKNMKKIDKVYTDPKEIKKMQKLGFRITKDGKIHKGSKGWKDIQRELKAEAKNISKLESDIKKIRTGRADADDLVKSAKNLKKAERSRFTQLMEKGGKWKAGAFIAGSYGARYAGGQVGQYLGGTEGAKRLGSDMAGIGAELGIGGASVYRAIQNPKVKQQLAKELMEHGTKEGLKRQGSKMALGRAVLSVLGKGAAKQVAGSSILGLGNVAMALWTAFDIGKVGYDYFQGKYE